ncbi:MAG: gamma-glutamyltransferase [Cyanobacteria bacterium J06649_4]
MAGVVAAGHEKTAEAGQEILRAGGNAFDAAIAALLTACVAEPTLTSLGGGGFLLAHKASESGLANGGASGDENILFDFFTQTPRSRSHCLQPEFYPIEANFGDTVQTFHVGKASMAVPGLLAGALAAHRKLGRLPLKTVVEPAILCARSPLTVTPFQSYCYELLDSILMATAGSRQMFAPQGMRLQAGDELHLPQLADTLEYLAALGDEEAYRAFYEGEIAQQVVHDCEAAGGYLTLEDFRQYRVIERSPLSVNYRGVQILTNPPPSAGGALIAFCLELLDRFDLKAMKFGSREHLMVLSQAMRWTNVARRSHLDNSLFDPDIAQKFVDPDLVNKYVDPLKDLLGNGFNRWGSTTHISVIDDEGNAASVTSSNGEGSSYVIPGTQIMMNNMLGEEDLNPHGFNQWPLNQRMSSMMAPTMILKEGKPQLVLGSGGSNRIRTAILQVISNILDFEMPLKAAVEAPRIHWENGTFHVEPGLALGLELGSDLGESSFVSEALATQRVVQWQQSNMFFGGVHSVGTKRDVRGCHDGSRQIGSQQILEGAGDSRRSGSFRG